MRSWSLAVRWRLLVAALLSLSASSTAVDAQMSADLMRSSSPDWSSARVIAMLLLQAVMVPCYAATLLLLWRRRRLYPIAGRGAALLLLLNASSLVSSLLNAGVHIVYARGMPCGMSVLSAYLFMPYAVVMVVRGYLLVFRLEIQNYLAELAWRKSKMQRLQMRQADKNEEEAKGGPRSTPAGAQSPLSLPSLEPSTIPGHFCISNRRFMDARWIMAALTAAGVALILSLTLTSIWDWDVHLTNDWREAHGFPRDSPENQYGGGAFFEGHRCLVYSIKACTFYAGMVVAFPFVMFIVWRLRVNSQLMERRAREQAEFEVVLRATAPVAPGDQAALDAPTPHAADSASHAPHAAASATEQDELSAVKMEMALCLLVGSLALGISLLVISTAYAWLNFEITVALWILWALTVVPALVSSYRIGARHRQMMLRARREKSGSKGGDGGGGGRLVALVPHHRPLYRLKHVLFDAHTYPVLLKFLQKEYSSENALFYLEARRFARESRAAERMLPAWRSSLDEEDESNTFTEGSALHSVVSGGGGGGGGSAAANATGGRGASLVRIVSNDGAAGGGGGGGGQADGGDQVTGFTSLAEQAGSAVELVAPATSGHHYIIMEGLAESEGDHGHNPDGRTASAPPSAEEVVPIRRAATFCPSETRRPSTERNERLFAIRVEQPSEGEGGGAGGGGFGAGGEGSSAFSSPLAPPSSSPSGAVSPVQVRGSFPSSPSMLPSAGWTSTSADASPGHSRATSGLSVEEVSPTAGAAAASSSPLMLSADDSALTPLPARGLVSPPSSTQLATLSAAPVRRASSPYSVRMASSASASAAAPARTELAWGPAPTPAAAVAAAASTAAPASPAPSPQRSSQQAHRAGSSKPLQRQSTRTGGKLFAGLALGKTAQSAAPKPPPLSFRQMHELACGLRARCLRLYDEYLRHNSVYQINVANDLAKMVAAQIAQVEQWQPTPLTADGQPDFERAAMESAPPLPPPFPLSSLFQQTALSIFNLMESDSFRRFLLTSEFEQLLQRADDLEVERLERASCLAADTKAVLAHADAALHAHAHTHSAFLLPGSTQLSLAEPESTRIAVGSIAQGQTQGSGLHNHANAARAL